MLQSRKVVPHGCSPKLLFKIIAECRIPKKFPKIPKLLGNCLKACPKSCLKLLPKVIPRRCSPMLSPKAVLQNCCPKTTILQIYSPKRPKAILQSGYRKLLPKVTIESCSPKLFVKLPPKAAPQSYCSSKYIYILFNFTYIYINYLCKLILHNVARNIQYYPILTNGFQPGTKKNVRDNFGLEMSGN